MSALKSIFQPGAHAEIGDIYRDRLGGPPFPITRDPKPQEPWYCDLLGCTRQRAADGTYGGTCSGYCSCC